MPNVESARSHDILTALSTPETLNLLLNDNNQQRPNHRVCIIRIVILYARHVRVFSSEFHLPFYHLVTQYIMLYFCSFLLSAFTFTALDKLLQLQHYAVFITVS